MSTCPIISPALAVTGLGGMASEGMKKVTAIRQPPDCSRPSWLMCGLAKSLTPPTSKGTSTALPSASLQSTMRQFLQSNSSLRLTSYRQYLLSLPSPPQTNRSLCPILPLTPILLMAVSTASSDTPLQSLQFSLQPPTHLPSLSTKSLPGTMLTSPTPGQSWRPSGQQWNLIDSLNYAYLLSVALLVSWTPSTEGVPTLTILLPLTVWVSWYSYANWLLLRASMLRQRRIAIALPFSWFYSSQRTKKGVLGRLGKAWMYPCEPLLDSLSKEVHCVLSCDSAQQRPLQPDPDCSLEEWKTPWREDGACGLGMNLRQSMLRPLPVPMLQPAGVTRVSWVARASMECSEDC